MKIAINTRFLLSDPMEGHTNFVKETFSRIVKNYPEHEFIFIFDRQFDKELIFSNNTTPIVAGPQARYPFLWKYWFDTKIPSILKKTKADVFVSCDGFCSLKTTIPQCFVVQELPFLNQLLYIKKSHASYLRKYTPQFLKKAKSVVTVSQKIKQDIIKEYNLDISEIEVVHSAGRDFFQPVLSDEKAGIQKKYSEGKEYFLSAGSISAEKNLINLLKAFSVFKKRQQTSMKLILAGSIDEKYDSFKKDIQSYKFRNDIVLTGNLDESEMAKVVGSAYGFINVSMIEKFPTAAIEAMSCNVPVISADTATAKEILQDAALFVDALNYTAIADKMMILYKDEKLRNDLIIKGRKVISNYSWDKAAHLLWQSIEKTIR